MASGSELAANKVGPTWEVGPTEDVIQALMETLVDPLLPLSVSNVPPPEDDQKSVAKQMHAVVLLYNYHHRKQKPELKFIDFASFCKLAVVLKPPLISFMELMMESELTKSNIADNHLSLTEKAIKEACDIALALDASSDFPNIEGWPISKVAVLLIDSKKENCMLRFGDVTKGVWSLIEKELDESKINPEILFEEKNGDKRKRNSLSTCDNEFLQLGYDAVKDVTGIGSSDLQVLGTHVTYSSSKEKSAVRFYMIQCSGSFNVKEEVSLKFLVESLQGPLAEKFDYGFWKTTTAVEFYHMLPYVELISCWLSGIDSCLPSLHGCIAQTTTSFKKELTQTGKPDLPVSKYNGNDSDNNSSGTQANSPDKIASENLEDGKVKSPANIFPSTAKDGNDTDNLDKWCDIFDSAKNKKSRINLEISDTKSEKTVIDDNVIERFNKKHDISHLAKREGSGKYCEILDKGSDDRDKDDLSSGPSSGLKEMNTNELTKTCTKSEGTSKKLSSKIRVYHHRRKNNSSTQSDACVQEDGGNLKMNTVDSLKSHDAKSRDEKVVNEDKGDVIILFDQNGITAKGNQLIQFETKTKYNLKVQASEEMQNALSLLFRKRQEMYSQICNMEDTLAFSENDIARIRDGGEVGLARECIKSILSGNYHSMLEHGTQNQDKGHKRGQDNGESQREKKTKLPEIHLPGKSSCQDLEYICFKNNWRLPRYLIEPSDGKFVSNVFVHGKDFELHSEGGVESKPCEARESAAARVIAKLRKFQD